MSSSSSAEFVSANGEFVSTSGDQPQLLNISFADDPKGSLGTSLVNCDKKHDNEMFVPSFAIVGKLLDGDTVAKRHGVAVGDCIIAVNGKGFRRFAPDYKDEEVEHLGDVKADLDHRVVSPGSGYSDLLAEIKAVKAAGDPPLLLSLERYGWDARPNSWGRFLTARDDEVITAMQMIQDHETWRSTTFPINLKQEGLQEILRHKAVSEIDVEFLHTDFPPTVYVDYGKLLSLQTSGSVTADDVVAAFVVFTERMLAKAKDPRHPKTCQFIDLSGISITSGFRVEMLKKIYHVFEPNYPETLFKMVMYPVGQMVATTAKTMLSFVNERTQKKFLITNSLDQVCDELGWSKAEVEECGGVCEFMHKHEKAGTSMLFEQQN